MQSFLNQIKSLLLILLLVSATKVSVQAEEAHAKAGAEATFIPAEMIVHHISDSHEWHIATVGHTHYTIPLPVILYFEIDGKSGWEFFMSSQFHAEGFDLEGERNESLPVDGGFKIDHHGHIYYEKNGAKLESAKILDLSITKNAASIMISFVLLLVVFLSVAKGFRTNKGKAPKGIQSFFEPIIVFVRDEIALPNIGEHKYMKFMPYLLTVFFLLLKRWYNNNFKVTLQ
ncbi:MAG: synthase subunit [Bacteroidota bacterium]